MLGPGFIPRGRWEALEFDSPALRTKLKGRCLQQRPRVSPCRLRRHGWYLQPGYKSQPIPSIARVIMYYQSPRGPSGRRVWVLQAHGVYGTRRRFESDRGLHASFGLFRRSVAFSGIRSLNSWPVALGGAAGSFCAHSIKTAQASGLSHPANRS